jgi:hypothetical protein
VNKEADQQKRVRIRQLVEIESHLQKLESRPVLAELRVSTGKVENFWTISMRRDDLVGIHPAFVKFVAAVKEDYLTYINELRAELSLEPISYEDFK